MKNVIYNISRKTWKPVKGTLTTGITCLYSGKQMPIAKTNAFFVIDRKYWNDAIEDMLRKTFASLSDSNVNIHLVFIDKVIELKDLPKLTSVSTIVKFKSKSFNRFIERGISRKG